MKPSPLASHDPKDAHAKPPFSEKAQSFPGIENNMRLKPDFGEDSYVGYGRLKDRVALITGGDSGIGRAVALAFAREGADVVISYLPAEQEDAEVTRAVIEKAGRRALLIPGDLADTDYCAKLTQETVKAFDRIDILVNNAAYQGKQVKSFAELDVARVEKTFRVNIVAMFDLTRQVLPHMRPGGSVINVASIQAYDPSAGILDYAATKGAIVAFSQGLAQELIEKNGVRVNVVAPGPVWTPLIVASFDEEKINQFGASYPMKRPAQPCELAPAFVFLASDEGRYVNGEVLGVTGGGLLA